MAKLTATEGKELINAPVGASMGTVYTRSFSIAVGASQAAAAYTLMESDNTTSDKFVIPAGTVILGAYMKTSATYGATATLALSTATGTFAAAGTNAGAWTSYTVTTPILSSTADEQVTLTIAAASAPSAASTIYVTLVCAQLPISTPVYTTYSA